MADSLGTLEARLSMSDFLGANRFFIPGQGDGSKIQMNAVGVVPTLIPDHDLFDGLGTDDLFIEDNIDLQAELGIFYPRFALEDVWFERAIVVPLIFSFGNLLSTQTKTINVYSSYRLIDISLDSVVNNFTSGVTLTDLPSLPKTIEPQSGFQVTLQVTAEGSPTFNNTIDWVFDVDTVYVWISGRRIVLFPIPPEVPLLESLEFLTDVFGHMDGSEQRVADRKNPRQSFEFHMAVDGNDRRFIENLLYDWQHRVFGIPIWTEPSVLTIAATAGISSITVDDTTLGDYRIGGVAVIITDRFVNDALEIASVTSTVITFTSPLNNSYSIGTRVYPLRTAAATSSIRGNRARKEDAEIMIHFRVIDNDVDVGFGSTAAFSALNSKVLLDGPNLVEQRMSESLNRRLIEFDNETGVISLDSPWTRGRRNSVKGFSTHSRQELWDMRKLLHALRGRQTSFYLPTFFDEFELTLKLQNGTQVINIVNVGFAQFAQEQMPSRGILRVIKTDDTILTRNINSAAEVDDENEQITVDVAWPGDIEIIDIERIEYVELVRADTDKFNIRHTNAIGRAKLFFPVKAVFE